MHCKHQTCTKSSANTTSKTRLSHISLPYQTYFLIQCILQKKFSSSSKSTACGFLSCHRRKDGVRIESFHCCCPHHPSRCTPSYWSFLSLSGIHLDAFASGRMANQLEAQFRCLDDHHCGNSSRSEYFCRMNHLARYHRKSWHYCCLHRPNKLILVRSLVDTGLVSECSMILVATERLYLRVC